MQDVFNFVASLLEQAEFWAVSTTGFGLTAVVSLLWNNRTNLTLLGQKTIIDGLKKQLETEVTQQAQIVKMMSEQSMLLEKQKEQIHVLNSNIFILSQAANIGSDNKDLISKNFQIISAQLPQIKRTEPILNTVVKEVVKKIEEVANKSTLDELISKVK
jgi:hypothetical protein